MAYPQKLTNENIQNAVDEIAHFLETEGVSKEDRIRLTFLKEEMLLCFRDRFGEDAEFSLITSRWGMPKVTLRVKGEAYDPMEGQENDELLGGSLLLQNLLDQDSAKTVYHYRRGCNEIVSNVTKEKKRSRIPGGSISVAAILGILLALLSRFFLPEDVLATLISAFVGPLLGRLMDVILLITGPLIFISVISGVCALEDIASLSNLGLRVINRFVVITFLLFLITVGACLVFFPGLGISGESAFSGTDFIALLVDIFPQDLVSPFTEGKTIQIVFLAFVVGVSALILEDRVPGIVSLISEANLLIFEIMRIVSKVIPVAVFLSIFKAIASNTFSSIIGVWKIVAANYLAFIPFCFFMLVYLKLKRNVNIKAFLSKISPVLMVAFSTASSSLSMTENFTVCREKLKADDKLCSFWIPLSHAMFSPSVVVPLVTAAFYGASFGGIKLSLSQLVIVALLVTQLSISSPKFPGGIMATFAILLSQLGLSSDAIGLLVVSNVFVVNANTALGMLVRDAEFVDFSASIDKRPEAV